MRVQDIGDESGKKVIYDFGAHNGDDIQYYLWCADRVVAVEANPLLVRRVENRFSESIRDGRLVVVNVALTADASARESVFYLHRSNDLLSRISPPSRSEESAFHRVSVPSRTAASLVSEYGSPWFIKMDLEGFDAVVLADLFRQDIRPTFISVEAHSPEILEILIGAGEYNAFKCVDGASMSSLYKWRRLRMCDRNKRYSFPMNAAGPFADDVRGPWRSESQFRKLMDYEKFGWKDIHATRLDNAPRERDLSRFTYGVRRLERTARVYADRILTYVDYCTRQRHRR